MQRKIIPDAENRLLILYALKTVGAMTDQQLLIVMTDTDLMNYITLQLTIADLESEGKLRRQGDTSGGDFRPPERRKGAAPAHRRPPKRPAGHHFCTADGQTYQLPPAALAAVHESGLPAPAVHLGQRPHAGKEAAGRVQRAAGERLGVADDRLRQPDAADHYADGEPADRGNGA